MVATFLLLLCQRKTFYMSHLSSQQTRKRRKFSHLGKGISKNLKDNIIINGERLNAFFLRLAAGKAIQPYHFCSKLYFCSFNVIGNKNK